MRIRTHIKKYSSFGQEVLSGVVYLTAMWVLYITSLEVCLKGSGETHEANELSALNWDTAARITHSYSRR